MPARPAWPTLNMSVARESQPQTSRDRAPGTWHNGFGGQAVGVAAVGIWVVVIIALIIAVAWDLRD
jgi:hypothetical protein